MTGKDHSVEDRDFSVTIREGTAADLEALLAAAAESQPGRRFGAGAETLGPTGEVDPQDVRNLFLRGIKPDGQPLETSSEPEQPRPPVTETGRIIAQWLDGTAPVGPEPPAPAGGTADAPSMLDKVMAQWDPRAWHHGTWRDLEWSATDWAALATLDHGLLRRTGGGREALDLPGWDERSIWGWDPPAASYFAQLWRNRGDEDSPDEPDIWINGWETIDAGLYRVTTTHMLAMEISLATGCPLPEVCTALGADGPWDD
jgi:hypothetical protein